MLPNGKVFMHCKGYIICLGDEDELQVKMDISEKMGNWVGYFISGYFIISSLNKVIFNLQHDNIYKVFIYMNTYIR